MLYWTGHSPMKRRLFLSIFISGFLLLAPFLVFSETNGGSTQEVDELNRAIAERRARIQQLEKSIEEYKKKIASKQLEAVSLKNQLSILDNRIAEVTLDITATQETLETIRLEIQKLQLSIDETEQSIERQKTMIAELIRTLSQEDGKNYVEIIATYNNFSDFYNKLQYLQTIEGDLGNSARALRVAKAELEEQKSQTEERKKAYKQLEAELLEKKQNLNEETSRKEDLLTETKASEKTFQVLLGTLKKQYQDTESEISSIERQVRKKLEDQEKLEKLSENNNGAFSWPTGSRYITAYFHDPDYPFRNVFEHNGIDIRAAQGTAVKAVASGYIARAKRCTLSSCYSYVMIIHSNGISTVYGHLSHVAVSEDQFVTRGDIIGSSGGRPGTAGAGPFVTGAHLHFEVRKDGIPVNALGYLAKDY